jgi:hypothetical protein
MVDLKSTVSEQGRYVTQIVHFVGGTKLTFHNLDTHSIKQGQMTKINTKDGRMIMINDTNVLAVEIFPEKK